MTGSDPLAPAKNAGHPRLVTVEEHFMSPRVNEAFKQIEARRNRTPAELAKARFIDAFVAKGEICEVGEHRLARMDEAGVDAQVLSYGNNSPMYLPAADAIPLCRQANDDLAAFCAQAPNRFYGIATLPVADPAAAADELSRCVEELGFKGAMFNGTFEGHFFDENRFFPIFERAAALGVPVQFHPGEVDACVADHYYAGSWPAQVRTVLSGHGIGWHYDSGVQYLRFILSGTLDRLPGLTLVCGHWGELLPYYLGRLNDTLPPEVTGLERSIKDYFHDNLYVSPSGMFYEAPFRLCLDELGADHILWASDYPYRPIGEARTFLEGFGLTKKDLALVAHGNAERIFGL